MPKGPEQDLQDAAVDLLHRYHFLVAHFRPAMNVNGVWSTPGSYDYEGFPDLIARRPNCPNVAVEVKSSSGKPTKEQLDWIEAFGGDGGYSTILYPGSWRVFEDTIVGLDENYPCPAYWIEMLQKREWRKVMKKTKGKIAKASSEGLVTAKGVATMTTELKMANNTPIRVGSGRTVYLYRGHGSDGSVCGYGPVEWDGNRERWAAKQNAKFRVFTDDVKEVKR